jgi:hypothetical protein
MILWLDHPSWICDVMHAGMFGKRCGWPCQTASLRCVADALVLLLLPLSVKPTAARCSGMLRVTGLAIRLIKS